MSQQAHLAVALTHVPEPVDASITAHRSVGAAKVLHSWRTLTPGHAADGSGDRDTFWDSACRLHAAFDRSEPWWLSLGDGPYSLTLSDHFEDEVDAEQMLARINEGSIALYSDHQVLGAERAVASAAATQRYATSGAFRALAGRCFETFAFSGAEDDASDLRDALESLAEGGAFRVVLRPSAHSLAEPERIDLRAPVDDAAVGRAVSALHAISELPAFGVAHGFIADEWIPVHYEYRVFVVGGEVVCGAGRVPGFAAFDASSGPFDSHTARIRGGPEQPRPDGGVRTALVDFARQAAGVFATEGFDDYAMDLGIKSGSKEIVVMDIAPLHARTFGAQPGLVMDALVARVEGR